MSRARSMGSTGIGPVGGVRRARLHARLRGPVVFVVGASGGGKSTLVRHALSESGLPTRVVSARHHWAQADVAERMLAQAAEDSPAALAIDDAHHLIGVESEPVLESFLAETRIPWIIVVSRTLPTFDVRQDALVTAPELAFRLDEVAALVREHGGRRIELETASRIRTETAGWAEPIRLIARVAERVDPESLDREIADMLTGDFAAAWLERVLTELPTSASTALAASTVLPTLDLHRCTRLLGEAVGTALISALDNGIVMNARVTGGRWALPPMLRRHLMAKMPAETRVDLAEAAAQILIEDGAVADAADALAHAGLWHSLAVLLESEPGALHGAARWAASVPGHVARNVPALGDAVARARADDRLAPAGEANRNADREFGRTPPPHAGSGPDLLASAGARLRRGDATGAVPLLRRTLRAAEAAEDIEAMIFARLALLVLRAPLSSTETTVQSLCTLERDAIEHGLNGIARIIRGAIAANCLEAPRRAVRDVVERCEQRGDALGAGVVEGIDLLAQVRRGTVEVEHAIAFADRCEGLGQPEAAAWARAAAVLGATTTRSSRLPELISSAEAAAVATGLDGPRALLAAAAAAIASDADDAERLAASAHRIARQSGLPRVPSAVPHAVRARVAVAAGRGAKLTVACFGGFRLRLDGKDADLRGLRPQARSVLRMLALNSGAPLHRELIADALWSDLGTESALHALHVSISSLRRVLPIDEASSRFIVERDGEAYRLGIADRADCDLSDFDDHLAAAATAKIRGDLISAVAGLRYALNLYSGDLLPEDGPAEWALGARDRYRLRAAEAAISLSHLEAHLGDARAAVVAASRAVEIDPWLDETWRTLVRMHRRAGDDVAALRAHDGYRRMRAALGIE